MTSLQVAGLIVLIPVDIVSGIVDMKDFGGVHAVVKNDDGLAIGI